MSAHGDSHGGDSHGHGHGEHKGHPTVKFYLVVAVVLTLITVVEVGPLFEWYNLPVSALILLSVVKFAAVVALFMHLWFDEAVYKKLFVPSLGLAVLMVSVVMALFSAFDRTGQKAYMGPVRGYVDPAELAKAHMDQLVAEAKAASGEPAGAAGGEASGAPAVDGAEVFKTNCVACHGAEGKGLVGPNLTDGEWIYGGTLADIEGVINNGAKNNPTMIAWAPVLGPEKVKAVASYVHAMGGGK